MPTLDVMGARIWTDDQLTGDGRNGGASNGGGSRTGGCGGDPIYSGQVGFGKSPSAMDRADYPGDTHPELSWKSWC